MRLVLCGLAAGMLTCHPTPALAQQGSIQISGAAQGLTGSPQRLGTEDTIEPDFGISWFQPRSRLGTFQLDLRGTERDNRLHVGRVYAAVRDVAFAGLTWNVEGGDTYATRATSEYRFSNLSAPAITFSGGAVSGRSTRGSVQVLGGRATAWRNIFGTDPDTLDQTLAIARGDFAATQRLDVFARASRITTSNLQEFGFTIGASTQASGGVRYKLTPAVQLIGDAGIVRYRRRDSLELHQDGSFLAGANVLLPRGWLQLNAARFSPGEFPAMNDPLHDREVLFAAGEYDVWSRVRMFGGWEGLRTNLDPVLGPDPARDVPRGLAARGFGGVRVQVGGRSTVTVRGEDGDTISRPIRGGLDLESDSGGYSAEWQSAFGSISSYTRLSWRDNVVRTSAAASYNQRDVSSQLFVRLTRGTQVFGVATLTRHETGSATGSSYWQAGGGAQVQLPRRNVWIRGEATTSRNVDLVTREFVPRESYNLGVNGELARGLSLAFNLAADRTPLFAGAETPWMTRSMLRITQTFATGSSRAALLPSSRLPAALRPRGTGTVVGTVYSDWNANGQQDADEEPLENIPLRLEDVAHVATSRSGEFLFQGVPAGRMLVGLDTSAVPVDFDLPAFSSMELDLDRGETKRLSFGLIPLGAVHGRVIRDANGNGRVDAGEEPVEGAVLVLDGGMRSEQIRKGVYRFDAVRSGSHVVALLLESLPEGAAIFGAQETELTLGRGQLTAAVDFLVAIDKRPELRRVFPPRGGAGTAAARPPAAPARNTRQGTTVTSTSPSIVVRATASNGNATFAVQVAALSDPGRARALARELESGGYTAYVLPPRAGETAPYRIRIGGYRTRAAATAVASRLERERDQKLWVVREDPR